MSKEKKEAEIKTSPQKTEKQKEAEQILEKLMNEAKKATKNHGVEHIDKGITHT